MVLCLLPGAPPAPPSQEQQQEEEEEEEEDSDDDLLDGSDAFLQQFRQQRLAEMGTASSSSLSGQKQGASGAHTNKPLPYFGEVVDIDDFDSRSTSRSRGGAGAGAGAGQEGGASSRQERLLLHLSSPDPRVTTVLHTYEASIQVRLLPPSPLHLLLLLLSFLLILLLFVWVNDKY
jgi:hypothetical protein